MLEPLLLETVEGGCQARRVREQLRFRREKWSQGCCVELTKKKMQYQFAHLAAASGAETEALGEATASDSCAGVTISTVCCSYSSAACVYRR